MIPESSMRVYLALGSTDMRKAINGLSVLVEQAMGLNPFSAIYLCFGTVAKTSSRSFSGMRRFDKAVKLAAKLAVDGK